MAFATRVRSTTGADGVRFRYKLCYDDNGEKHYIAVDLLLLDRSLPGLKKRVTTAYVKAMRRKKNCVNMAQAAAAMYLTMWCPKGKTL